jgi:glycosyltransferase involved in cell wall biosynthesis
VTVLVPARDEERDIDACLAAVAAQDYPRDRIEVVVVDGASKDATAARAESALTGAGFHRAEVIRNPAATTPSNLNVGLAAARGEVLCRVDARSRIPTDYVRRCVAVLAFRPDVVVVGGSQVAVASRPGALAAGIARALNNRWAMGLSRYRRGAASGPSDTVYLGAFRTAELRGAGGWDEGLPTNQDFELNRRLGRDRVVWFEAGLDVGYVPRSSLGELFGQYHRFGRWKVRYWRRTGDRPRPRQLALLVLPPLAGVAVAVALSRPAARPAVLAGAALIAGVVEVKGSRGPSSGPLARVVAVAAMAAVATGWNAGAWRELAGGRRG